MGDRMRALNDLVSDKESEIIAAATTKEEAEQIITKELDAYKATVDASKTVEIDVAKQGVVAAIEYQVGLLEGWVLQQEAAGQDMAFVRDRIIEIRASSTGTRT